MRKLYRYLAFYFKMTFRNLSRNLGLAVSAVFSVSITLTLITVFVLVTTNLSNITQNVQDQVTIRATIDNVISDEEKEVLYNEILTISDVKSVVVSTGEEELEAYKQEYQNESNLFAMYEGDASPIRDAYIIEVETSTSLQVVSEQIKQLSGIQTIEFGGDATASMLQTFITIRNGSFVFIIFLILVAVLLISNKIKMSIYTRKQEIAIMRYVGASNWSTKIPMMLEGVVIGFIGSILPIAITIGGYCILYNMLEGTLVSNMFILMPIFPLTIVISSLLMVIGILVGFIGSFISTTRYLHWKR